MEERRRPDVERVFREEYGRAVSVLVRAFGDIDLAEEGVQEAFAIAAARWPDRRPAAQPGRLDHHDGAATGSSTGCGARRPGTTARRRPRSSTSVTSPTRSSRCTTTGSG